MSNGRATAFFDPADYADFLDLDLIGDACKRLPMRGPALRWAAKTGCGRPRSRWGGNRPFVPAANPRRSRESRMSPRQ